jgi:hypothetical protein
MLDFDLELAYLFRIIQISLINEQLTIHSLGVVRERGTFTGTTSPTSNEVGFTVSMRVPSPPTRRGFIL